jgi:predicted ATP-grasp superfamily ATP-dependent carboligase
MPRRVLLVGVSTRAFAESATRAGYEVIAIDGFGDLDLRARVGTVVRVRNSAERFGTSAVTRAARGVAAEAVAYVASFENHPRVVQVLARHRTLWGNSPAVLARVRDPARLARTLAGHGHAVPAVRTSPPRRDNGKRWLMKPRASGGGHAIVVWQARGTARLPRSAYLQERITGVPGSLVFAANGLEAVLLGFSRLLVGEHAFGARRFRYCGNILAAADDPQFTNEAALLARGAEVASAATEAFRLVGVNGVDFIASRGRPYVVEVNPRYTASMELVERAYGLSVFETHARACAGRLPAFDFAQARAASAGAIGKAVVYARRDTTVGDTRAWLADDSVRDIPTPGEAIGRGQPVCTVFARGRNAAACHQALVARAAAVYAAIGRGRRGA